MAATHAAPPADPPIPQPGDLLGWVILFGPKLDMQHFVPAALGETAALNKVSHLERGVIVRAVAG